MEVIMHLLSMIGIGIISWTALSIPVGLLVGKCIAAGNMRHCMSDEEYYGEDILEGRIKCLSFS